MRTPNQNRDLYVLLFLLLWQILVLCGTIYYEGMIHRFRVCINYIIREAEDLYSSSCQCVWADMSTRDLARITMCTVASGSLIRYGLSHPLLGKRATKWIHGAQVLFVVQGYRV